MPRPLIPRDEGLLEPSYVDDTYPPMMTPDYDWPLLPADDGEDWPLLPGDEEWSLLPTEDTPATPAGVCQNITLIDEKMPLRTALRESLSLQPLTIVNKTTRVDFSYVPGKSFNHLVSQNSLIYFLS